MGVCTGGDVEGASGSVFREASGNLRLKNSSVKSTIDCLYPIIGGKKGSPEDWRVDFLEVEKGVQDLDEDSVRIEISKV